MKHENLMILKENGINVPNFIVAKGTEDINLDKLNGVLFAVRSSCNLEDNKEHSFAGQFKTRLNVPSSDIKNAFKEVRQSILDVGNQQSIYSNNVYSSLESHVIIQEMISADYSGVIFTANPSGILNETVIVVGKGLGENVVDDKEETSTYFCYDENTIFHTSLAFDFNINIVKELYNVSQKIMRIFDKDMDIEFAIKDDIVYILQARPITTVNYDNVVVIDNSNIIESYPGISLPLTQEFVEEIYTRIFQNLISRLTRTPVGFHKIGDLNNSLRNMVVPFNWRMYYKMNSWYDVISLLPFKNKIISYWQDMMGVENKLVTTNDIKIPFIYKLNVLYSFIYYMIKCPKEMSKLNNNFSNKYSDYVVRVKKAKTIEALLHSYDYIMDDVMENWDITLINDMYTFIFAGLAGHKNRKYVNNIKELESMKPILELKNVFDVFKLKGADSIAYKEAKEKYIKKYGDRVLGELKLETKTFRTNPELLEEHINNTCDQIINSNENITKSKNVFVKKCRCGIQNREISRMNRSKLFGITRQIFLKIGVILKEQGRIDNERDIFYLHIHEIENNSLNLKDIIIQRKEEEIFYNSLPLYNRVLFDGNVKDIKVKLSQNKDVLKKDTLCGVPTSFGKVIGEVIVIENPSLEIDTTNKIIVTKSTDPGWVFLIKNAKGIIAERGSLLSHTAIISRELKKPAIVSVKNATDILQTGNIVELDADNNFIKILKHSC